MAKKSIIPVYVVEDHNDVLYHIYRAIGSKRLPFTNGAIVHFDSHPDLMLPEGFDSSKIFDKEYVLNTVSIESWLLPSTYAGHFSSIAWIKPPWALQLDDGRHNFWIGCHRDSKEIKLTCPQSYFVGEMVWSVEEELENSSEIGLVVGTLVDYNKTTVESSDSLTTADGPNDLPPFANRSLEEVLGSEFVDGLTEMSYVLDIDLDFFSTLNPFVDIFTKEQNLLLTELCHYEHPKDESNINLLSEASVKRIKQMTDLKSAIKSVKDSAGSLESIENERLLSLLKSLKQSSPTLNLEMIHYVGCSCPDCILPHHISTEREIHFLVNSTREFLSRLPRPSIITIARSSRDDYCPPKDVDFIQGLVLEMLTDLYGSLEVKLDYETIEEESSSSIAFS